MKVMLAKWSQWEAVLADTLAFLTFARPSTETGRREISSFAAILACSAALSSVHNLRLIRAANWFDWDSQTSNYLDALQIFKFK